MTTSSFWIVSLSQRLRSAKELAGSFFPRPVDKAISMGESAILIYSHPEAAGFYEQVGCIKIGETPFYLSQDLSMPMMVYSIPAPTAK